MQLKFWPEGEISVSYMDQHYNFFPFVLEFSSVYPLWLRGIWIHQSIYWVHKQALTAASSVFTFKIARDASDKNAKFKSNLRQFSDEIQTK